MSSGEDASEGLNIELHLFAALTFLLAANDHPRPQISPTPFRVFSMSGGLLSKSFNKR
jgi:hypothetical protein